MFAVVLRARGGTALPAAGGPQARGGRPVAQHGPCVLRASPAGGEAVPLHQHGAGGDRPAATQKCWSSAVKHQG